GLHVVGMRQYEFLVLRRRRYVLAELARAQGAIDQRHRHRLALALSEGEPIAAGETRRLGRRSLELVDHLALGHRDPAKRDGETDLLGEKLDLDLAKADLAGKRMGAAEAALRRVAERQQEALVAAGEILQADVAPGRKRERIAREIAHRRGTVLRALLDEA